MANTYTDLLKMRMPALGDLGWDDEVNDNVKISDYALGPVLKSNVVISGCAVTDGGGLDVDVAAGQVVVGGSVFDIAATSKTCMAGQLNWLYVDDAGAVQIDTAMATGDYCGLALVDAGASTLDRVGDARNFMQPKVFRGGLDDLTNKILNADFTVAQDGDSFTGITDDDTYTLDMWRTECNGATLSVSQNAFTPGQTDVPGEPAFYLRCEATVAGADWGIKQAIESVRTLAGGNCAFAVYARANAAMNIELNLDQQFGTGGATNVVHTKTAALTTTWQQVGKLFNLTSISGKTIGTDHFLDAQVLCTDNTTGYFDIAVVRLNKGLIIGNCYDVLPPAVALWLCQRHYVKLCDSDGSGAYPSMGVGCCVGSELASIQVPLPNTMRKIPAITYNQIRVKEGNVTGQIVSSLTLQQSAIQPFCIDLLVGGTNLTTVGRCAYIYTQTGSGYLAFNSRY